MAQIERVSYRTGFVERLGEVKMSMLAATILLAQLPVRSHRERQCGLLRRAEGRRPGPQDRAQPLRRLRCAPE